MNDVAVVMWSVKSKLWYDLVDNWDICDICVSLW